MVGSDEGVIRMSAYAFDKNAYGPRIRTIAVMSYEVL